MTEDDCVPYGNKYIGGADCDDNICVVTPVCGQADIVWTDPPQCDPSEELCPDVIDARQPHPVDDNSPDALQGLGRWRAPAEPITIQLSESLPQALSPCCWDLCSTQ